MEVLNIYVFLLEISISWFHLSFKLTPEWSTLQGMAPEEYKWQKEFPLFCAKGSAVLMLVNFVDGNSVKPVFGFNSYFFKGFDKFFPTLSRFILLLQFLFRNSLILLSNRETKQKKSEKVKKKLMFKEIHYSWKSPTKYLHY